MVGFLNLGHSTLSLYIINIDNKELGALPQRYEV